MEKAELGKYNLIGLRPTFVTDCGGNVSAAVDRAYVADWMRCGCHLLHNVVEHGFKVLATQVLTTRPARKLHEAITR